MISSMNVLFASHVTHTLRDLFRQFDGLRNSVVTLLDRALNRSVGIPAGENIMRLGR